MDESNPLATTAGSSLDHDWEADLLGDARRLLGIDFALCAGHDGHAGLHHQAAGGDLVAQQAHRPAGWADELLARLADGVGEVGVLSQEAVPGMNAISLGVLNCLQDLRNVEVAFERRPGAQQIRLIRIPDVKRKAVGV